MTNRIFISYRRDDSQGSAGRLRDKLVQHFPPEHVFMDVDTVEPGIDFVTSIEKAVGDCDVLLAVIGKRWLSSVDSQGRPRLESPEDYVGLEIAAALARDIRVVPVLVDGAEMPRSEDMPRTIASLARRNAVSLRHDRFDDDSARLIEVLKRALGEEYRPAPRAAAPQAAAVVRDCRHARSLTPNRGRSGERGRSFSMALCSSCCSLRPTASAAARFRSKALVAAGFC